MPDVTLAWRDGRREIISISTEQTILDGAEAAGIALPFGCRTGACGTCTGRLLRGELAHRREPRALKDRHRDAGYVLTCLAEPRTTCEIEVGTSVASDLVSNPWK